MKKILILFIVALVAVGGYNKLHNQNARTITPTEEKQLKEDKKLQDREAELRKLQNPELVTSSLRKVGKLTTLEGTIKYGSVITDTFISMTMRQITLDLSYSFGLGINLEYIKVNNINERTIIIEIPRNRMQLQYIQLNQQQSKIIDGKKMFLVNQFKPSEVEVLINQSQQFVANSIGKNEDYYNMALKNLEFALEDLICRIGYSKVEFEVI